MIVDMSAAANALERAQLRRLRLVSLGEGTTLILLVAVAVRSSISPGSRSACGSWVRSTA